MHELAWLREKSRFTFSMIQLLNFFRSRIDLERETSSGGSFKIVPHDFPIGDWCTFDETSQAEVDAFHEFCRLALSAGSGVINWMPRYISQIDFSGVHVALFVEKLLSEDVAPDPASLCRLADLAAPHSDTSEAWTEIANPICRRAQALRREEREGIYIHLRRKELIEFHSSAPGRSPPSTSVIVMKPNACLTQSWQLLLYENIVSGLYDAQRMSFDGHRRMRRRSPKNRLKTILQATQAQHPG